MTREHFLQSLDELLELPPGTLQGPEKLEEFEGWNSVAMLGVIALADQNGVKLSMRQIATSAETVDQLADLAKAGS